MHFSRLSKNVWQLSHVLVLLQLFDQIFVVLFVFALSTHSFLGDLNNLAQSRTYITYKSPYWCNSPWKLQWRYFSSIFEMLASFLESLSREMSPQKWRDTILRLGFKLGRWSLYSSTLARIGESWSANNWLQVLTLRHKDSIKCAAIFRHGRRVVPLSRITGGNVTTHKKINNLNPCSTFLHNGSRKSATELSCGFKSFGKHRSIRALQTQHGLCVDYGLVMSDMSNLYP